LTASIDPRAVVDATARIGRGSRLGPFCVVESGAEIGAGCVLEPFSRVCRYSSLGDGARLGQGAVVGGLPQVTGIVEAGNCRIGDRTRVGEYATIHGSRNPESSTSVGDDCFVMAYAHVGHDCILADGVVVANGVQLAGHVEIERYAFLGGGTLVHQFVRVGEYAFVAGGLRLEMDLAPWSRAMGEPARWAGVNLVGMRRSPGAPAASEASDALRTLFRRGLGLAPALEVLTESDTPVSVKLKGFIERSRRGLLRPGR
jgi:UDP-N-acetylglucosamine acyltransferase